ncbi:3-hydroxyacyl-CoA dehydrogenase NAD-binding domain-containing protein [Parapedomonas caeni]
MFMSDVMHFEVENGIAIVTIDSPPVNALSQAVRQGITDGFQQAWARDDVQAIVLICGGRTFFAGADISEFGKPLQGPDLLSVLDGIENGSKLTIAAIHGNALGGGLELALHCHYRIAVPSAKLGLPEVHLGLLPGAGGTQRLPRIVGVPAALDLMTSGRPIGAREALSVGVIDALAEEGKLRDDAVAYARRLLDEGATLTRVRDRDDKVAPYRNKPEIYDDFRRQHARGFRGFKAPENIIKAIQAAADLPFDQGIQRERELFVELRDSKESAAQRYAFFAERETAKVPGLPKDTPVLPVTSVGVIGAGTMGGGITMNFLNIGMPVTLVEASQEALDRGIGVIRRNYETSARKGKLTNEQVEKRMALITPSLDYAALAGADLVIEAVFESMAIKKEVFARLDKIAKPGAILASNTSFLDLDEIAATTSRPENVIGLHFFSPANVMRLLEVVRGQKTAPAVINTAMQLAKKIGKVPVLAGVCDGFIANRAMRTRGVQADALVLEGVAPADIDRVIYAYGFAMGPFQMTDLVGLDVIGRDSTEKTVRSELVKRGRLGQKQGGGYYDYDENRRPTPSPVATEVIREVAAEKGIAPRTADDAEILARLLYPVVNEGAKILEEGIAIRASDIDVALMMGYNWPVYTGGPMFWAETVGLANIVAKLKELESRYGAAFKPAALLEQLAASGKGFRDA